MAVTAVVLAALSCAFVASALVVLRRELRALVSVSARPLASPLLVVIPARNEAARIRATLESVLRDPQARVLVVDDRSSDDTAALASSFAADRVRVVRLDDDPAAGVYGKPRALAAAVDAARADGTLGDRVLFLDADVVATDGLLGGLCAAMDATGADAVSGVPALVTTTAVEQMLVPALASVVTGRFTPTRVHNPNDATAFLNGQIILLKTAALDDAGGWASVQNTVLEDVALARRLKSRGRRLRLADLRGLASTRMYESFAGIADGFGKNATALLGKTAGAVGVLAFATSLVPWLVAAAAAYDRTTTSLAAVAVVIVTMGLQATVRRLASAPLWPVLVLPIVYAGVAYVLLRATFASSSITWKGRKVGAAK